MSNTSKTSYNSKFREDAYYGNMAEQIGPLAENNRINGKQPQGVPQESPTVVEMQALPDGGCVCDVAKLDFSLVTQEQAQAAPWALKGEGGGSEGGEGGSPAQQRSLPEMMSDLTEDEIAASPFAAKTELSGFAYVGHNHDDVYALKEHSHDDAYSPVGHDHDSAYAAKNHGHDQFGTLFEYLNLTTDGTTPLTYGMEPAPRVHTLWPKVSYRTRTGTEQRVKSIVEWILEVSANADSAMEALAEAGLMDYDPDTGRPIPKGGGGGAVPWAAYETVVSDTDSWPTNGSGELLTVQEWVAGLEARVSAVEAAVQSIRTSISDENAPWVRKTNFAEAMAGFIEQHQNDPATLNQTIAALTDLVASLQNVATAAQA